MKKFFFTYKNPVSVVLAVIILGGLFFYGRIQTSLFPEITFPKIKVIADNGEQPVDKMMISVTRPLEDAIKKVPDLNMLRSSTSRGECEISAFLDWNADIDVNQQMLESRIAQIKNELPPGVTIQVEKMNPSILPVIGYTVESDKKTPIELN
jgi:multidrug efflux pump subunit AcrB